MEVRKFKISYEFLAFLYDKEKQMPRGKRSKKKNKNKNKLDLQVVTLIVVSVLLAVLIYSKSGYIGETLSPILGGIMGFIKYIIPIGMLIMAIFLACNEEKESFWKKILQYAVLLLCITTVMTVIQVMQGNLDVSQEFDVIISEAYNKGTNNIGGGAVGAIFGITLIKLLGKVGTIIFAIGVALIDSIFLFGIKPAELLKKYIEEKNERIKEAKLERNERIKEKQLNIDDISVDNEKRKKKNVEPLENNLITEDEINIKIAGNENKPSEHQEGLFKKQEEIKEDKSKEVLVLEHTLTVEDENYEFPPIDFLKQGKAVTKLGKKAVTDTANKLQKTLYSFGVSAKVENVSVGPSITRYELKPAEGVRVNKIANLADDIALSLAAETIRIEAPIPGKHTVGIEIPNKEKEIVALRDIIDSNEFRTAESKLSFALGKDAAGEAVVTDIAKMPHVLIAGSTGSRKKCLH